MGRKVKRGSEGWRLIFFFKQKTAYEIGTGDWSSDVCSSDLKNRFYHHIKSNLFSLFWGFFQISFKTFKCSYRL